MAMLTGAEVWAATIADPSFALHMPEGSPVREAFRPFVEAIPLALAEFLDRRVTLNGLANAKIAFIRYCIENGFVDKVGAHFGSGAEMMTMALESTLAKFTELLENLPDMLFRMGVSEDDVMLGPKVRLNPENQALYRAGELTIEQVLRTQPSIILKNTD